jgi:hypothetical protein
MCTDVQKGVISNMKFDIINKKMKQSRLFLYENVYESERVLLCSTQISNIIFYDLIFKVSKAKLYKKII